MDVTFTVGEAEIGYSTICILGGICEMVQLTGGNFSKVNGLKAAVNFKVFEPTSPAGEVLVRYGVIPSKVFVTGPEAMPLLAG